MARRCRRLSPRQGLTYWRSGVRYHFARRVVGAVGPERAPWAAAARAFGRVHSEIVAAATRAPADVIYGGTTGALAAVAESARRLGVRFGVDFEDLHSAETAGPGAAAVDALASRIERDVSARADFVTTSSDAIATAYRRAYGIDPLVIHNAFPLPSTPPDFGRTSDTKLRLYWFSQTISPGRGLEEIVAAIGLADIPADLDVRGRAVDAYAARMTELAHATAPRLTLRFDAPISPDAIIDSCRPYDIGLAIERTDVRNRALCLTNKALTYPLAGLAVVLTETEGQRAFGLDLGDGALMYRPGDVQTLARGLRRWHANAGLLVCAKRAAWHAAVTRWHWEHRDERDALVRRMESAVS